MAELIDGEEALQIAISQVEWAWELKDRVYWQFLACRPLAVVRGGRGSG